MSNDLHVRGMAELQQFLDQVPVKVEVNILRGALRAAMRQVLPVAKAKVGKVSGLLAAGLKIRAVLSGGRVVCSMYALGPHGYLGHFLEFGVKPHYIKVQEGEKLINKRLSIRRGKLVRESMRTLNRRSLVIGGRFVGPVVFHPGFPATAHRFMRPAMDQQAGAAVLAAAEYMKKRLATKEGMNTADIELELIA